MADYRSVQTRMWREDEWFDELDTEARLFWIYLFTNPSSSPAGIFRLTMRTMSNESGIPFDRARELMEQFGVAKKAYYSNGVVWLVNMRRLQFPDLDGSGAWQVAKKMRDDIDNIPDSNPLKAEYLRLNGYPMEVIEIIGGKEVKRVSIQYGYPIDTQPVNETVTETVTETVESGNAAAPQSGAVAPAPATEKPKRKPAKEKAPVPEPVTWFRSVVGRFPPKVLFAAVVDVVETRRDEAFLKRCQTEWIARGYNPSNYAWLLDWYGAGIIPATRGGTGRVVATNGVNSHAAHANGSTPNGAELERRISAARAKLAEVSGDAA